MRRGTIARLLLVVCAIFAIAAAPSRGRNPLDATVPDLRLEGTSLGDALDFLRDISGANLHVNWGALEGAGIGRDTTINLRLRAVPLRKVLNLILTEAAGGNETLTWYVDEGIIEVTTRELADKQMFTRLYPVEDLLLEVPDFIGPSFNINTTSQGGGGGGTSILEGSSGTANKTALTRAERAEQLIELITTTIQPDIWQINGGTAAIRFFNGSLIVTAPRSVHEALGN